MQYSIFDSHFLFHCGPWPDLPYLDQLSMFEGLPYMAELCVDTTSNICLFAMT